MSPSTCKKISLGRRIAQKGTHIEDPDPSVSAAHSKYAQSRTRMPRQVDDAVSSTLGLPLAGRRVLVVRVAKLLDLDLSRRQRLALRLGGGRWPGLLTCRGSIGVDE